MEKEKGEGSKAEWSLMELDFEEKINNTHSANNIPVPVTVPVSEDRVANPLDKETLGNSWKGTLASGHRFLPFKLEEI